QGARAARDLPVAVRPPRRAPRRHARRERARRQQAVVEVGVIRRGLAVLLTIGGVVLLGLAWQVHAWHARMADDDLRFQVRPTAPGLWHAPSGPGASATRQLLGVDDDLRFRDAEHDFVLV